MRWQPRDSTRGCVAERTPSVVVVASTSRRRGWWLPLLGDGPIAPRRLNHSYTSASPIIVVRIVATWRSSSPVPA